MRFSLSALLGIALLAPAPASARTPKPEGPGFHGRAPQGLYAIREPHLFQHNVGLLRLQITNVGLIGNPFIDDLSAGWQGHEHLFFSGLWLGAIGADQEPHVSTAAPGELRPEVSSIWTIYESFEGIPRGTRLRPFLTAPADDDNDGVFDEDFHDGLDNDVDGEIDEDFSAAGQQMFSAVYHDATAEAIAQISGHVPLGLTVRQRTFQWSAPGINEFVGLEFEVINSGVQVLEDLYLGWYCDSDIGPPTAPSYWNDDLVGWDTIDTTLSTGLGEPCADRPFSFDTVFMWDAPNTGSADSPGVFGYALFGHPMTTIRWGTGPSPVPANDDATRYQTLSNASRASGNPLAGVATASAVVPDDYHYVFSAGPFTSPIPDAQGSGIRPGESLRLRMAAVVGDGFAAFRENAAMAASISAGYHSNADNDPATGIDGKETCLRVLAVGDTLVWSNPCDTLAAPVELTDTECLWVDADCNPCTGVDGLETTVNWAGLTLPANPITNLPPTNREAGSDPLLTHTEEPGQNGVAVLLWDNSPECRLNPVTGEDVFFGYEIWKAVDEGTGPPSPGGEGWLLLGVFVKDPMDPEDQLLGTLQQQIDPIGTDPRGCPLYPIGRYRYEDTGVVNGQTYYYSINTIAAWEIRNPVTDDLELTRFTGPPHAEPGEAVSPCDTCDPVPVRLLSFLADRTAGNGARLRWRVAEAENHAGFHVHRGKAGPDRHPLTEHLLTGTKDYEFVDPAPPFAETDYWLEEVSRTGVSSWHGPAVLPAGTPPRFSVGRISPNPMRSLSRITYSLSEGRLAHAAIYDLHGRKVRTLQHQHQEAGEYTLTWRGNTDTGRRVAAGVYILRIEAGRQAQSRKILVLP